MALSGDRGYPYLVKGEYCVSYYWKTTKIPIVKDGFDI